MFPQSRREKVIALTWRAPAARRAAAEAARVPPVVSTSSTRVQMGGTGWDAVTVKRAARRAPRLWPTCRDPPRRERQSTTPKDA